MTTQLQDAREGDGEGVKRRDFLYLATAAVGLAGGAAAVWPLIESMEPAADTLATGAPIEVDLSPLQPGQQILVIWQGKPIFIVRRPPEFLQSLKNPQLISRLRDPDSRENQQPDYVANQYRSIKEEYWIAVAVCTHLGCVPTYKPKPESVMPSWLGGYLCTCHGSLYDFAGRVFKNVPAPYNLPVPPHYYVTDTTVRIGKNPPNTNWDFGSIRQI